MKRLSVRAYHKASAALLAGFLWGNVPLPACADVRDDAVRIFSDAMAKEPGNAPIHKWAKDIRFSIIGNGEADPRLVAMVGSTFAEIERVSGLKARYTTERSNFIVILVKDVGAEIERYRTILRSGFSNDTALDEFIGRAKAARPPYTTVEASTKQSELQVYYLIVGTTRASSDAAPPETYLVRGILTGMGLGSGNASPDSALNLGQNRSAMTDADALVVRAFYSRAITPGMTIDAARRVFPAEIGRAGTR